MTDLYEFDWPVDQHGYDAEHAPSSGGVGRTILSGRLADDRVRRRGGPFRYYRPMERPGLWRRFAETCESPTGVLAFVNEFGLLADDKDSESTEAILDTARLLRLIAIGIDRHDRSGAAIIFNAHAKPRVSAEIVPGPKAPEFRLIPLSLRAALLLQAGEAINGDRQLKRCRNCPEWFQIGAGAHTARRDFCTDRCRVAWSRKPKPVG